MARWRGAGSGNPPFSDKRWSTGLIPDEDPWQRFQHFGVPPAKQGDYAYLLHILRSLKPAGNPRARTVRLNTDLAKKPRECLEYIVVHEMVHLLEPTHNARFIALMDHFMPKWQSCRQILNRLPVRHESWGY